MYVRLVQFGLGSGKRSAAEAIANKIVPAIRAQKGCDRCEFITDDAAGEYGIVVLWASLQAAGAAYEVINPVLQAALSRAGAKGTSLRFFEVYEPKSRNLRRVRHDSVAGSEAARATMLVRSVKKTFHER